MTRFIALFICLWWIEFAHSQQVSGRVIESISGDGVANAVVKLKTGNASAITDSMGYFRIIISPGQSVVVSASSFQTTEFTLPSISPAIWELRLTTIEKELGAVNITHSRLKEKLRESPVTVESQTAQTIKQTPASDFYEGLGHLRGVDVTAASMGFRIINTRGFNSTSPVRSLQMIDGVDNQAPGLNFSLGNFLGSSELDVLNTDIIVGASSAYFGPNAFNGVINMTTKNPWEYKGLSAQVKIGERQLGQLMIRYANAYKNKKGKDIFAWKINMSYLRAYDWVADNKEKTSNTLASISNPGGYDAVNRYGDETLQDFTTLGLRWQQAGQEYFNRTGYWEKNIVNYNTRNLKTGLLLAFKINSKNEIQVASNFGTGTTVYQGDNRFSLNDILFFQNRIEWKGQKGHLRFYVTNEDAGNTFDAVLTALQMQNMVKHEDDWLREYSAYFFNTFDSKVHAFAGYPAGDPNSNKNWLKQYLNCMEQNKATLQGYHDATRIAVDKAGRSLPGPAYLYDTYDFFKPGTARFDSLKREVTSRKSFNPSGEATGSRFFDKSAMFHFTGEKRFSLHNGVYQFVSGFSSRMYRPYSLGTVFLDMDKRITNVEFGLYTGVERRFNKNRLKANITARLDKNQNFNFLFSPAASLVYSKTKRHTYRMSFSSAIRNPTLQDQYLNYNVGRAILLGNLNGLNDVCNVSDYINFLNTQNRDTMNLFRLNAIKPEKVKTFEIAYKGVLLRNRLTFDVGYYYSLYRDFIGYRLLVGEISIDTLTNQRKSETIYRVASNSPDKVSTQGFSAGVNYFFGKVFMFTANWSWNQLDRFGSKDPLIPAFNTPKNKFNVGFGGVNIESKIKIGNKTLKLNNLSFNINLKWIEGFQYEGSPQFTGDVPTYWMLDAQISKFSPKLKTIFKLGASNLTNNMAFQVYGGPKIGRMAYFSATIEL